MNVKDFSSCEYMYIDNLISQEYKVFLITWEAVLLTIYTMSCTMYMYMYIVYVHVQLYMYVHAYLLYMYMHCTCN